MVSPELLPSNTIVSKCGIGGGWPVANSNGVFLIDAHYCKLYVNLSMSNSIFKSLLTWDHNVPQTTVQ